MAEAEQGRVVPSIAQTCAELRRFEKWREGKPGMRGSPRRLPRRSVGGPHHNRYQAHSSPIRSVVTVGGLLGDWIRYFVF